jgi:hypothetical protein
MSNLLINIKKMLDLTWTDVATIGERLKSEYDVIVDTEDGCEYRFIHEDHIYYTYHDETIELIKECYELGDMPAFITIDWDATVTNCLVDGYGNHFSCYDGSERKVGCWYIFRLN